MKRDCTKICDFLQNTLLSNVSKTSILPASTTNFRERSCGWRSLNEYGRPASIADVSWLSRSQSEVAARGSSMMVSIKSHHRNVANSFANMRRPENLMPW